jgi:hypothetical protein
MWPFRTASRRNGFNTHFDEEVCGGVKKFREPGCRMLMFFSSM